MKILWLAVALVGCGVQGSMKSSEKIFGGTAVKAGDWAGAVGIGDEDGLYCTGTAVAPKLVITAAHCLEDTKAKDMRVYVGNGADQGRVKGQYRVARAAMSPLYDARNEESDHDVAYLVLQKALDLPEAAYIPVAHKAEELDELLAIGQSTHIVGFGDRENGAWGVKYEASTTITAVNETEVTLGGEGRDSCYGDSGGPAYGQLQDGSWRVYGVVSRGGDCGEGGIWGLMHANICWVQSDSGIDLGISDDGC